MLQPGEKKTIEYMFMPSERQLFPISRTFIVRITYNEQRLKIVAKGHATCVNLSFPPKDDKLVIGPVLPYDDLAYTTLEIKNETDYNTELFSLDFDKQYIHEESQISKYEPLQNEPHLCFPVREPGMPLWEKIIQDNKFRSQKDKLEKELIVAEPDLKDGIQKKIDKLEDEYLNVVTFEEVLDDDRKHNIVVIGPSGSGKTNLINYLAGEHKRGVVSLADLLEWHKAHGNAIATEAEEFLTEKVEELE